MRKAIQAPLRQIVENAGVEASIVVGKLLEQKSNTFGFDAQTEKYVDLVEAGIVDPTKVVRTALQDASSVAALLITTEAMVADRPKKNPAPRKCRAAAWVTWTSKSAYHLSYTERAGGDSGPFCFIQFVKSQLKSGPGILGFFAATL